MSSTRSSPRQASQAFLFTSRPDALEVDEDVFGLDARGVLSFVVEQRRRQDVAAAHELRAVTAWADLHEVTDGGIGSVDDEIAGLLPPDAKSLGLETELRLAGQGTFMVTEFGVCELAAALDMSETAARAYVGQALELRDRLPRLWGRVMNGELAAWKARRIAEETIALSPAAAAYVDAHLAPFADKLSLRRILAAVHAAIGLHDPALARERALKAADGRGVWRHDHLDGTSEIHALASTPDALAFDSALDQKASELAALGDIDPEQVRRAKALGILADPQHALDLTASAELAADDPGVTRPRRPGLGTGPTFHVHLHTDSLAEDAVHGLSRVEAPALGRSPYAVAAVEQWLADLAPGAVVKVTPVADLTTHVSVDAYEVPERLRQQVDHRDPVCVFPWCGRRGRFDVDHTESYDFGDPELGTGPPPGQTSTSNTAKLCRFHHRVKTHGGWRYRRRDTVTVEWTSPLGRTYLVDPTGTRAQSG